MYSWRSNSSVRTSTWRIPWAWANSRAAARSRSGKLAETAVTAKACSPSTSWKTAAGRAESARRRKAVIMRSSSRSRAKRRCSGSVIEFPQPVSPSASSWRNKIAASCGHLAPSGLARHYTLAGRPIYLPEAMRCLICWPIWLGFGGRAGYYWQFLRCYSLPPGRLAALPAASARPGRQPQPEISVQLQNPRPKEALGGIKGQLPA